MEGDHIIIKRIALLLAAVIAGAAFGGCGQAAPQVEQHPPAQEAPAQEAPAQASPESRIDQFYVRNVAEDYTVALGDKKADIEPALAAKGRGPDYAFIMEFVEENIERWRYEGNEGIALNYDLNDSNKVCGIRVYSDEWELPNGLRVGMSKAAVASMYDKEMIFKFTETEDLWLGFDENGNPVPFEYDPPVPYLIYFEFEGSDSCSMITVQDNRPVGSIF